MNFQVMRELRLINRVLQHISFLPVFATILSLGAKSGYQCSAYAANFSFSNQASYC